MEKSYKGDLPVIVYAHEYGAKTYKNEIQLKNNCVEITYVLNGSLHFVKKDDDKEYVAKKDDMLVHCAGSTILVSSTSPHAHRTVGFMLNIEGLKGVNLTKWPTVLPASKGVFPLHQLIDELIQTYNQDPENKLLLGSLALELLSKTIKKLDQNNDGRSFGDLEYVKKAKQYIFDNMRRPILQTEIADYLKITPGYLCNIFKRITGETIMNFINRTKLRQIKAIIEREKVTLAKASEAFGYADPNYVSRIYKKLFGENITKKSYF